jgi:hypothetical protein
MGRHQLANGAFGSRKRPLGSGHDEPERRGHRAVTSESALDRPVEAAQTGVGELPAGRVGAAKSQTPRERADLAAGGPGGPDGVAFMATIDARHGVEQIEPGRHVHATPRLLANRRPGVGDRSLEDLHHRDQSVQREAPVPGRDAAASFRAAAAMPVSPDRRRASAPDVSRLRRDRIQ